MAGNARRRSRAEAARAQLDEARARMYHDLIVESAEQVFGDHAFEEATMREVAQEAGISLKTLYATFPGKQELYREIHAVRGRAFLERMEAAMQGGDTLERLEAGMRAYVDFLLEHESWLRMQLRQRISWGLGPADGIGSELWREGVEGFARVVKAGIEEGVFHEGDPQAMAAMSIAIMQVQLALAVEAGERDAERLANEILLHLRRLLCRPAPDAGRARRVA
ncbi:MAG: TetR/AcrR family transcriptional regulator [Myxococcota bacterium]|nr:TetR/AcrR family transcriptional regulator [Myxococcota bacterium]